MYWADVPIAGSEKLWGNSFLAKRTAEVLIKIGIVATVTVGGMDAVVEPSGTLLVKCKGGESQGKQ
ncbi:MULTISPECIES: hypothetical protein [unclassified Shewanella]|uniref:hypothetical protein n=1 Tax=Shewanella TaxID=22 RepID=UPI0021D98D2F|nr:MULTISPECIES: hypothetical protein [unclassified Shewanella]MCU8044526.1 hypothetical protein [Shewanella sp. SM68]MCU8048812.1 hypothetical protein [Shewanella sp. SM65]